MAESTGAAYKLLAKIVADIKSFEVGGTPNGEPITLAAGEPPSSHEIARRLLLLFNNADREILAEAAEAHDGPAVALADATPTSAFSSAFVQNAPQNGPQAPVAASGGLDTSEGTPDSPAAAEADDGPKLPKVGQTAYLDYAVRITNSGPQRDGLPNTFVITDATGKIIKHCGGDYSAAVKWARERFSLPDAKITVASDPRDVEFSRPDEREPAPPAVPTVTRSYEHRKAFLKS